MCERRGLGLMRNVGENVAFVQCGPGITVLLIGG